MNGIRVPILLFFLSLCHADTMPLVRGRVQSDLVYLGTDMMVELQNLERHAPPNRASVAADGSFEFREVTSGRHALRLMTQYGDVICEQAVEVFAYVGELSIRLPKLAAQRQLSQGRVSVRQLQRPVPAKAYRAFVEAGREAQFGHRDEAIRKLELALRLHPDYPAA